MAAVDGPDFICIGLPKAGTGWLFDQLDDHPDFWMPPVKELLYLEHDPSKMGFVKRSGEPRLKGFGERRVHREGLDARDNAFLQYAASCRGEPRDMERYAKLFSPKGELLSGDISAPYWHLDVEVIDKFSERFPKTKIIMLVRDPVARAWSRLSMAHRDGQFHRALIRDREGLKNYVETSKRVGNLRATEVMDRWRRFAPQNPFGWILFDDIVGHPDKARTDLMTFLGVDPARRGATLMAAYNRKSDDKKLVMNDVAQSVLVEHYADELRAGAKVFGETAAGWQTKYGL